MFPPFINSIETVDLRSIEEEQFGLELWPMPVPALQIKLSVRYLDRIGEVFDNGDDRANYRYRDYHYNTMSEGQWYIEQIRDFARNHNLEYGIRGEVPEVSEETRRVDRPGESMLETTCEYFYPEHHSEIIVLYFKFLKPVIGEPKVELKEAKEAILTFLRDKQDSRQMKDICSRLLIHLAQVLKKKRKTREETKELSTYLRNVADIPQASVPIPWVILNNAVEKIEASCRSYLLSRHTQHSEVKDLQAIAKEFLYGDRTPQNYYIFVEKILTNIITNLAEKRFYGNDINRWQPLLSILSPIKMIKEYSIKNNSIAESQRNAFLEKCNALLPQLRLTFNDDRPSETSARNNTPEDSDSDSDSESPIAANVTLPPAAASSASANSSSAAAAQPAASLPAARMTSQDEDLASALRAEQKSPEEKRVLLSSDLLQKILPAITTPAANVAEATVTPDVHVPPTTASAQPEPAAAPTRVDNSNGASSSGLFAPTAASSAATQFAQNVPAAVNNPISDTARRKMFFAAQMILARCEHYQQLHASTVLTPGSCHEELQDIAQKFIKSDQTTSNYYKFVEQIFSQMALIPRSDFLRRVLVAEKGGMMHAISPLKHIRQSVIEVLGKSNPDAPMKEEDLSKLKEKLGINKFENPVQASTAAATNTALTV